MISTLIVDDEGHNRDNLRTLLKLHCPELKITGEAASSDEAFQEIKNHAPQLVFLDIKMPGKSGFELLKMFQEIRFEVVFVTAFDRYAIKAFEFGAVGYILKPIDVSKLKKTVEKAIEKIKLNTHNNVVLHFVKTLSDANGLLNKFPVHHNDKVVFIEVADISFIEAKEDSTVLTLFDNSHYYSSKDLGKYETVLEGAGNFIRINKSVILNTDYIKSYSKGEPCCIELKTGQSFEVSRRRKAEILKKLHALLRT
jgi:two-component system LytT family response regulator